MSIPQEAIVEKVRDFSALSRIENGMYNYVFRGTFRGEDAVLKMWDTKKRYCIGGFEAELGVLQNGKIRCKPELLDYDRSVPYVITKFIQHEMMPHRYNGKVHARKIAEAIKEVHSIGAGTVPLSDYYGRKRRSLENDMDLIEKIPSFADGRLSRLLDAFRGLDAELVERARAPGDVPIGQVHGDFLLRNTIVSDDRVFFTDWEESHVGCPYFDIAKVCLIQDQYMREFMKGYFREDIPNTGLIDFFKDYYRIGLSASYIAHKGAFAGTLPHVRDIIKSYVMEILEKRETSLSEEHIAAALAEGVC